ncbi:alanine racemase [Providencia rettgeri]|uniref:alanine racemase n=1 Tax=Providencia rettgeri TaxID=587 RepID=UPI001419B5D0|nr:alanine racemase [Providencia rettgeri]ELU1437199.1 alanine racemase [Providencia rettgeri]NIA72962.1 alanine racemase [Providencia rettgeri]NIA76799.1 alanine racemase [Providencia rettgeri]NIB00043.1 alanine racemase [Providencia rettgeri]NIB06775.1 alanine racemase [Providencia rettgeri]
MPRPISAVIHLQNLQHNLSIVRQYTEKCKIWSVMKADGYGHGIKHIWPALKETDGFAVLDLHEAILLRDEGWKGPILLLEGFFQPQDLQLIDQYNLTTSVHSDWQLAAIENAQFSAPISVYIKLNSGMNRLGFSHTDYETVVERLAAIPHVKSLTLMSHFANSDTKTGVTVPFQLIQQFQHLSLETCIANSGAALWHQYTQYDWIRTGILLYGASPSGKSADIIGLGLKAAMSLQSEVIAIHEIEAGQSIGYGSRFTSTKPMRIATVACGYADGYPRHAPNGTPVWCQGMRCALLGAVSMDMLTIDVSDCRNLQLGDKVELWGQNLPVDDVAHAAGTIGYELLCALAKRVPVSYQNSVE